MIVLPTELHLVFKRHQMDVTSISVDMNRIKTSVPDVMTLRRRLTKGWASPPCTGIDFCALEEYGTIYREWY